MDLTFKVENQIISRTDSNRVVRDSQNYLNAVFSFTDDWSGTITAVFRSASGTYNVILEDNQCLVPWEVLVDDYFRVSVFCGDLITANIVTIRTIESGYATGKESRTPTEDVYNQIIAKLESIGAGNIDYTVVQEYIDTYISDKGYITQEEIETIVTDYITENIDTLKGADGEDLVHQGEEDSSSGEVTKELSPNVFCLFNSEAGITALNLTLADGNFYDEYMCAFTTSSSGCVITLPSDVEWLIEEPTLEESTYYELSIVNKKAVLA